MIGQPAEIGSKADEIRIHISQERGTFGCAACGSRWIAIYEVRDYEGPTGERWIVHSRDGSPVPAPAFGDRCPTCGRISVAFDPDGSSLASTEPRLETATG